jgi:ABC-type dipeptide/oligopeptide/nickel transport system, ATPase component
MPDAPLLDVRDLSIGFPAAGGVKAVERISFSLEKGRTLALVGESGSGKSVTALSIPRLLPHGATVSGEIRLRGENLLAVDEARMRQLRGSAVTMVFQEPMTSLNPLTRSSGRSAKCSRCMAWAAEPRGPARSNCSTRSASAIPRAGSAPSRISSPAASVSA